MAERDPTPLVDPALPARSVPSVRRVRQASDGVSVALFSVAAFLVVLALLVARLNAAGAKHSPRRVVVVRRVYRTTVIERVVPAGQPGRLDGTSVSQSVSGSSPPLTGAAPVTRAS